MSLVSLVLKDGLDLGYIWPVRTFEVGDRVIQIWFCYLFQVYSILAVLRAQFENANLFVGDCSWRLHRLGVGTSLFIVIRSKLIQLNDRNNQTQRRKCGYLKYHRRLNCQSQAKTDKMSVLPQGCTESMKKKSWVKSEPKQSCSILNHAIGSIPMISNLMYGAQINDLAGRVMTCWPGMV